MMKKLSLLIFVCLVISANLFSQRTETLFDRGGLTGIWGSAIFNHSFYNEDWNLVRGGNIGLEFGNSVFVAYSWNKFKDDVRVEGTDQAFRMRYRGLLVGLTPRAEKVVHPRISFFTGGGKVFPEGKSSDRVFVFQPSGGFEINVFHWFRVGLEGGYRFVSNSSTPEIDNRALSAPFAQLELRFGSSSW